MTDFNVQFIDKSDMGVIHWYPITLASKTENISNVQKEKDGKDSFTVCPGMADYRDTGWIMPAWTDIHVFASDKSTMVYYGDPDPVNQRSTPVDEALKKHCPIVAAGNGLSPDIPARLPIYSELIRPKAMHFTTPWAVESTDLSFALMPAYYHGNIARKIHIYPGIIDTSKGFNTMNMIAAPIVKGRFMIKAGTPLFHIIPLQKGNITSTCRIADKIDLHKERSTPSTAKQWYRKMFMRPSKNEHTIL
jgi:hypothetical protein